MFYDLLPDKKIYSQELDLELFTMPKSDGTPVSAATTASKDCAVIDRDFVVAITNSKISDALEMPLLVAFVPQNSWKII